MEGESARDGGPSASARLSVDAPLRRVLFVTGRLAEPALRRVLTGMAPPFECDVAVMKITVAALMTTEWIARSLQVRDETDLEAVEFDESGLRRSGRARPYGQRDESPDGGDGNE